MNNDFQRKARARASFNRTWGGRTKSIRRLRSSQESETPEEVLDDETRDVTELTEPRDRNGTNRRLVYGFELLRSGEL